MRAFFRSALAILLAWTVLIGGTPTVAPAFAQPTDDLAALSRQAAQLYEAGRFSEAVPIAQRALMLATRQYGPDHPAVGSALNTLANNYRGQGRFGDAEPLYKQALSIREKALGLDHPDVAASLNRLAGLYVAQGRYAEAEPLYRRALEIYEQARGRDQQDVGTTLSSFGTLYYAQGRYADAEALYKRALPILETALWPYHPSIGTAVNNLAAIYERQGRYTEAEPLYARALNIREKAQGPDHPSVATALNNLAALHYAQDRFAEAEPLYRRALAIYERSHGPDHPNVGIALDNLARVAFALRDWANAVSLWQRSIEIVIRRSKRGTDTLGRALTGKGKNQSETESERFFGLSKAAYLLATAEPARAPELAQAMFQTAQSARSSEAAASVAQMAARQAKGDGVLARLVRERQDLVEEWQGKDSTLISARSEPPTRRNAQAEAGLAARLAAIDSRIAEIDETLAKDFPDYAALASPEPLAISEVQGLLRADEALLLFFDMPDWEQMPEETFVWVVTRTDTQWVRSAYGAKALNGRVAALRCGLDRAAWDGDGALKCARLLSMMLDKAPSENEPLPFDVTLAHDLYQSLFGQIEDLARHKHLLIVPSGALTQLPLQALVTDKPGAVHNGTDRFRRVAWLSRRHAITVLPAVSSLKALRQHARTSRATRQLIGFGNPLLDGPDAGYAAQARLARDKQQCSKTAWQRVAGLVANVKPVNWRSGLAEVADIRGQVPLPETADELCAVARDLGVPDSDIRLGGRATERDIKSLSANGSLSAYRIVHFATHGTLAGELRPGSEPGLILTPPERASSEDDGYLSASEIAALKIDADWVILSACNTAAGGAHGAEAMSGLARAFFYAGARALLVSHWAVYSDSTVKLITKALAAIASDKGVGRSEALRQSMLALIDTGDPREAHPAYWAPFVVVGDGSR